ncbi:MAG: amidohydrolase [Deltaproteobacteria bacterium]|nr:amidohydrolase [Deltaproteobacteria bacterium]
MEPREVIFNTVDELIWEFWEIAQYLYENPELSGEENKARDKIVSYLSKKGFNCEVGVAGLNTAFVARFGDQKRPSIAFVAEYDALPDLGHACGHNLIAASAVGAAVSLVQAIPELSGQVAVIGSPAEEVPTPPAKQIMLDHGVFDSCDVALMVHGSDRTVSGAQSLAVDSLEFEFVGKSTHASKYPYLGRSALDGAILTMTALEFLREHVRQDVRIHGVVSEGGSRANIVPEYAKLSYKIRALDRAYLNEIRERVFNCARAGALASGTEVNIKILGSNDNKILIPTLDRVFLQSAIAAEAINVMEPEAEMGSTDFGNVSQRLPAATLKVSFVEPGTAGHSREWAEAACKPEARRAVAVSSKAMAWTAYRLLTEEDLLKRVKKEFQSQIG